MQYLTGTESEMQALAARIHAWRVANVTDYTADCWMDAVIRQKDTGQCAVVIDSESETTLTKTEVGRLTQTPANWEIDGVEELPAMEIIFVCNRFHLTRL
jgi:hypothetical protein